MGESKNRNCTDRKEKRGKYAHPIYRLSKSLGSILSLWDRIKNYIETRLHVHWAYVLLTGLAAIVTVLGIFYSQQKTPVKFWARQLKATTDPNERIKLERLVLEANPSENETRLKLACDLAKLGSWNEAETHFSEFTHRQPEREWVALVYLSIYRSRTQMAEEALEPASQAVDLHGQTASPHLAYGDALEFNKRDGEAYEQFSLAVNLPGDEIFNTSEGHGYAMARQAMIQCKKTPENAQDHLAILERGTSLLLKPELKAYCLNYQGYILKSLLRKPSEALKCHEEALEIDGIRSIDKCYALNSIATIYFDKGEYEKSLNYRNKAYQIDPKLYTVNNELGYTYLKLNEPEKAAEYFTNEVKARCSVEQVEDALGELVKLSKLQDAISLCQDAANTTKMKDERLEYMCILGSLLFEAGRYEDAVQTLNDAINNGHNNCFEARKVLWGAQNLFGEYRRALSSAETALSLADTDRKELQAQMMLAHSLKLVGKMEEANQVIDELIEANGNLPVLMCFKADLIHIDKDAKKAYEYLEMSLQSTSEDIEPEYVAYAGMLGAINRDDKVAIQRFKRALELGNLHPGCRAMIMFTITELALDEKKPQENQNLWLLAETLVEDSYHSVPKSIRFYAYLGELRINIHSLKWKEADLNFAKAQIALEDLLNTCPPHLKHRYSESIGCIVEQMKLYEKMIRNRRVMDLEKLMSDYKQVRPTLSLFGFFFGG